MKNTNKWAGLAITAILTTGVGVSSTATLAADTPETKMEKCYGIVKAGANECASTNHPCQGQSTKDGSPNEWIYVPEGTCAKIVGGVKK